MGVPDMKVSDDGIFSEDRPQTEQRMDIYIPDVLIDDYERMAKGCMDRQRDRHASVTVPVHANVLLGLIRIYRNERARYLQQRDQK